MPQSATNTITREEFVELRGQVTHIAQSVENLTATFKAAYAERETSQRAEVNALRAETDARFEKNERIADDKEKGAIEGKRWLIGTIATLTIAFITVGTFWTNSIKDSVSAGLRNEIAPIREQVIGHTNSLTQLNTTEREWNSWRGKVDGENASSIKDREQLNKFRDISSQKIVDLEKELATFKADQNSKLAEIETQFRAVQQTLNGGMADVWRVLTILWDVDSAAGMKMPPQPSGPYYTPDITKH